MDFFHNCKTKNKFLSATSIVSYFKIVEKYSIIIHTFKFPLYRMLM
jgi:hypothetical protein